MQGISSSCVGAAAGGESGLCRMPAAPIYYVAAKTATASEARQQDFETTFHLLIAAIAACYERVWSRRSGRSLARQALPIERSSVGGTIRHEGI
jgi:hypothetical protein